MLPPLNSNNEVGITSTYQLAYKLSSSSTVTQATITDPNGNVEQKSFDTSGFVTTDIYAMGSTVAQTYSYTRDANSERITAMTDPLGRQFSYSYDSFQLNNYLGQAMTLTHANLLSVTCSNCLAQSITTSRTYDPTFNQQTSVTDVLNHTWSIGYDSRGNATSITDYVFRWLACQFIKGYKEATSPSRGQTELPLKEIGEMEKKALNRPVSDLARTGEKELIDVITSHSANDGEPQVLGNGSSHADRVQEALGNMFMDIICSHCGSDKVIRAGACGVCTECGTSQGCS